MDTFAYCELLKVCTKCGESKPYSSFSKHKLGKQHLRPHCKLCQAAAHQVYRKTPARQKYLASAEYKSKKALADYKYRSKNKVKRAITDRLWRYANRSSRLKANSSRKRLLKNMPTQTEMLDLLESYSVCPICGCTFDESCTKTVDHIVPLKRGGSNTLDNMAVLCGSCNSSKGSKSLVQYLLYRQFIANGT